MPSFTEVLVGRTARFAREVDTLCFSFDGYVYNPLIYAWDAHEAYLRSYVREHVATLFLGMNPGPFGMAQTGVPFGEADAVRNWMGIERPVGKPPAEHPARPVKGFGIGRSEVSGRRFWSLMAERFGSAEAFFSNHAVMNYCPLVFVDAGSAGRNVVPARLPAQEREALEVLCDAYLDDMVAMVDPRHLVGVGLYAGQKLKSCNSRLDGARDVVSILHPSPSNPRANAGWAKLAADRLEEVRIW